MKRRILVTFPLSEPDRESLTGGAAGCEVRFATAGSGPDDNELAWADTVFGNVKPPDRLIGFANIRWLHSPNVGLDDYTSLIAARPDLLVSNPKGIADDAVSDHALALLLAMTRAVPLMVENRRAREWARASFGGDTCRTLSGMEVHVIGFGSIGRRLVEKLRGFGTNLTIYRRDIEGGASDGVRFVRLSRLAACVHDADALVNVLPSLPETRHCVDGRVLGAIKRGALFVNVGRGATVDEKALVAALEFNRLGGAALDVFENEPLPGDSPLWTLPRVILSPHVAGRFAGEAGRNVALFLEQLADRRRD